MFLVVMEIVFKRQKIKLKVVISKSLSFDSVYPFDQLNKAIEKLDSRKAAGKIVLEVAKE